MAEKDDGARQGDLLKALDDLTDLITEQEQRGGAWNSGPEPDHDAAFEELPFDEEDDAPTDEAASGPRSLPSPAEIETLVDLVLSRRMDELRRQLAREIMIELRKRHPEL